MIPANDSHWHGGPGGCHEKEGKEKNLFVGMKGGRTV